jgi:hypothetical protein
LYEFYTEGGAEEACRIRVGRIIDAAFADLRAKLAEAERREEGFRKAMQVYASDSDKFEAALREEREKRDKLVAAAQELRNDANRLCDRNLGGTYEEDCRRSIAAFDAALAPFK